MFGSLIEIEAETRKVFSTRCTDDIPSDFVIAFMSATADTVIRFMRARESDSERYRELRVGCSLGWFLGALVKESGRQQN